MKSLFIQKSSIQHRLIISYVLLIGMIVGIIGITLYKGSELIIEQQVGQSRLEVLEQVGRNLNGIIGEITSASNLLYFNEDLNNIIRRPPSGDSYQRLTEASRVLEIFSQNTYSFDTLDYYTVLYSFKGKAYTSWINDLYNFSSISKHPWFSEISRKNGKILWVSTFNDRLGYGEDKNVFSAARLMKDYYSDKPIGILLLNVDEKVIRNTYQSALGEGHHIYVVDQWGKIVSDSNSVRLGRNINKEKNWQRIKKQRSSGNFTEVRGKSKLLYSYLPIPKTGWFLVEEVSVDRLLVPVKQKMKYLILGLLIFCLMFGFVFSYVQARRISLPIRQLHYAMREVEGGNLQAVSEVHSSDEIGDLSDGFNRMVDQIQHLLKDLQEQSRLKRQLELEFLQAEINPHFLYNTLTSIRFMVEMGENEGAQAMLLALGRLLQRTIGNSDELITLREELAILKDYVLIQQVRYSDKFELELEFPEESLEFQIPKLILQPMVENAIFHGIEPKVDKGRIVITGKRQDNDLIIEVSDNGVGMTEEQLRILWQMGKPSERTFSKIGVVNVHQRLVLNFGPGYGLKIGSVLNQGTIARLRLPAVEIPPKDGGFFENHDCG